MSNTQQTLSQRVSDFVASRTWDSIPAIVRERAALVMLDAIGTAFAASRYPFAPVALSALSSLGSGDSTVIGMDAKLACALMRGKFGLNEIEALAYTDPQLLKLAHKVSYEIDPNPGFPKSRSGEVIVKMKKGGGNCDAATT